MDKETVLKIIRNKKTPRGLKEYWTKKARAKGYL